MNPQAAAEIDEIEHEVSVRLQILVQAIAAHTQSAPYTANMLAIPDHIPPSTDPRAAWAKPFREYIARAFDETCAPAGSPSARPTSGRKPNRRAALHAGAGTARRCCRYGFPPLSSITSAMASGGGIQPVAVANRARAALAEQFRQFPLEQQRAALQAGVQACEQGYHLSRALRDEPCQALFLAVKGRGLYEARQLEAAVAAYEEAEGLYRSLAAAAASRCMHPIWRGRSTNKGNALLSCVVMRRRWRRISRRWGCIGNWRSSSHRCMNPMWR
jgi:hypothetical protein